MNQVDRRTFLVAVAAAGLTAACGDNEDGHDHAVDEFPDEDRSGVVEWLVPTFPDGYRAASMLAAGIEQRVAFVVRDDVGTIRANAPDAIDLTISFEGERVVSGSYAAHRDGLITPYYPVVFTPAQPGMYTATVAGTSPVDFLVADLSAIPIVQIGDSMRPVATPTIDRPLGVEPICTRAVQCPFHDISLDDALESGRPTVLLVATPGFCQTDICGPVVDLLMDAVGSRDDLAVVHGEVYIDPSEFETGVFPATTPVVDVYSLPFEPQLVVADATGTIVARLDTTWDRAELAAALSLVL